MTVYPWPRFALLDVAGELIWVILYVSLGRLFSDKVEAVADLLGNFTCVVLGLAITVLLGWKLWKGLAGSRGSIGHDDVEGAAG
jgi:membrane protein DedA with SNARE-associated domain